MCSLFLVPIYTNHLGWHLGQGPLHAHDGPHVPALSSSAVLVVYSLTTACCFPQPTQRKFECPPNHPRDRAGTIAREHDDCGHCESAWNVS